MHTLFVDVYTTRRQRMHHIETPDGQLVWSGLQVVEAIEWLLDRDIPRFRIEGLDWSYKVSLERDTPSTIHQIGA